MHDTAVLLSRHFMKERLQYGLYGLYPKYRIYNEPLTVFLGMVGHALVVLTLQADRGSLADQCESICFSQRESKENFNFAVLKMLNNYLHLESLSLLIKKIYIYMCIYIFFQCVRKFGRC